MLGVDGFLTRVQLVNSAERTVDLQYYIFHTDETGKLLTEAVLRAADRGVRVRVLIDDGETMAGDEQLAAIDSHPDIEVRIFNPFAYRGHVTFLRALEFMINHGRLDYRMHNKLMVVDNALALIGGRNVANEYFQVDPQSQFADDDVFSVGPIGKALSHMFEDYWNCANAIPVRALDDGMTSDEALAEYRKTLVEHHKELQAEGVDYAARIATGEPLAGMLSGKLPLTWAHAELVSDSPDKRHVDKGERVGRLMRRPVAKAVAAVQSELLMVTPYFIPGEEGMPLFAELRKRNVRVRILTNSLQSSTVLPAQAGYMPYRLPLLEKGVEIYEVRSRPDTARGSGQTPQTREYGNYSLHAKLFVLDRQRLFVGSMNFDPRSMHLNTEIGVIMDSPDLAQQAAARFEAMVSPPNSYALKLAPSDAGGSSQLIWHSQRDGTVIDYTTEPARNGWQRFKVNFLSLLPLESEL